MKNLIYLLFIALLFSGCSSGEKLAEEDCKRIGKTYKVKKVFNIRYGVYEEKGQCI